jgi:hypothetical protein
LKSVIGAAIGYFMVVFLVGFVLGVVRELWLLQWINERYAELLEMPVILFVSFLVAKYVIVAKSISGDGGRFLLIGFLALIMMVGFELTVVLGLRGLNFSEYIESRDVISGSAYVLSLVVFMLMPWLVYQFRCFKQSKSS